MLWLLWYTVHRKSNYTYKLNYQFAIWLVLTYDVLEGRCIDDVITILFLNYIRQVDSMLPLTFCPDVL